MSWGRGRWLHALLVFALLPVAVAAEKAPPQRELLVELREADAAQAHASAPGWSARSADASTARVQPPQLLRVSNGASASLALSVARPLQTWQIVPGLLLPVQATQWIKAGQTLVVQPSWPGGREPVSVSLAAESSRLDPTVAPGSAEPPQRNEARVVTTLRAPLGQWVTIAASGAGDPNVVASGEAVARRVLQLRVSLVP